MFRESRESQAQQAQQAPRVLLGLAFREPKDLRAPPVPRARREFRDPLLERATRAPQVPKELLEV